MRNKLTKFLTSECPPKGMRQFTKTWKYAACMLLAFILGIGQMWGAYYTPTADEVVIIKEKMSDATNGYGTSTHGAFSFAAEITSSNKQMGSASLPIPDGSGNATYSTYKLKGNGGVKNMTLTIAGCSKLIIYNKSHSSRYVMAEITPEGESMSTQNGTASTTSTEITLDGSKSYSIWVYGYDGSSHQDIEVYAFKLIKDNSGADPVAVTGITIAPSPANVKVGKTRTLSATVTPNNATDKAVTWAVTSGGAYASVVEATGVVTGLAVGTATITATAHDGSGVTQTVTVNVEECPTSGTIYKFQLKTGLTNGNLVSSDSECPKDIIATTDNYLSSLVGGSLTIAARNKANRVNISNGNAIGFANGEEAFLKMDLDCSIQAGDILKYDITSNDMILMAGSETEATNRMTLSRNVTQVEVDSKLVGADALYMKRSSSSPRISYFEVFRPVYHAITLVYADGATADGNINALDGEAATKPADPTWAHHRFDGWYNGSDPYDWSANVTGDLTLTAHWTQLYTVTYEAGDGTATGDAPTEADKAATETFTVAANSFTVAGKDFVKWNDGTNDYAPGATYTVGTDNVVLTAQWKAAADKYTVIFKDGETELGTKLFEVSTNPSDADIDKTKALNTFAAWQKEGVDIALDDAFWATVAKDAEITLTARWAKAFATSVDLEGLVEASGTGADWQKYLSDHGYAFSTSNVSLDEKKDPSENKPYDNWPYQGLKAKVSGAYVEGNIEADKLVIIKLGHMAADATVTIDGVAQDNASGLDAAEPAGAMNYYYLASEGLLHYETTNAGACILKAITITDPFTVSFEAHGDADPASLNGTPSVTLPTPTNGSASFLGWFDAETGGNKIGEAGASYTPTANITLHAQWEAVSTDTRIKALTYTLGAAAPVDIYEADKNTFNIALPYAQAYDAITVAATPNHASASIKAGAELTVSSIPGTATFTIVAQSGAEENYTINFTKAPKDGVEIIGVVTTGGTNKTVSGLYQGDATVNLDGDKKIGSGKYIYVTLASGYTFEETDVLVVDVAAKSDLSGGNKALEITTGVGNIDGAMWKSIAFEDYTIGENIIPLTGIAANQTSIGLKRSSNQNAFINGLKVYRPMNPVLTAITINGEAGTIDESAKTVAVELQPGYDLAALTIVPTIVSNTAEASVVKTVESNGGAWVIGDNTYRLTDKDGDYTDYTITLSVGVLKHTVSFNTHGGSAIADVEVEDGQKLTAAPADPTKEDYIFQGWAETDGGSIVDVTTITISDDKEFHAVWAADGAIKLLDGATVNHTNFITGVTADETVEFMGNTVNYAKFAGTCGNVNNVKDLTKSIIYNATTNKTKIQISAHNNSTSGRNIYVIGLVEGASEAVELANISLGNKEDKVSDWIEFDNAANRTIYIMVPSSAGDVYFTQVKVIESGETPMKQAGETGYSLNFNKGRFFGIKDNIIAFEGLNVGIASSDCQPLNTSIVKLNNTSMSFTVASAMTLSVTTNNNKTYYVTEGAAGTDNETAKTGVSEFNLTAGTWYITAGASNVEITNIAFSAPKCAEPVIDAQPASKLDFAAGDMTASVTAHATDGGTLKYQWYKAEDDSEVTGATDATLTTTSEGKYYVIVTNTLADHSDNFVKSDEATLKYRKADDATLSSLSASEGTLDPTFDPTVLEYDVYLPEGTTTVPTLTATATMAGYAEVVIFNEGSFTNHEAVSTVTVTSEDLSEINVYTVRFHVAHAVITLVDVTGNTTWDWTDITGRADGSAIDDSDGNGPKVKTEDGLILANYLLGGDSWDKIEGNNGAYAIRKAANKYYQGASLHMHTTVPGVLKINARNDGSAMKLKVGNIEFDLTSSFKDYELFVPAGDVTIYNVPETAGKPMRVSKIIFTAKAAPDYPRSVSNNIGTLCVDHNVPAGGAIGATFYQLVGKEPTYGKLVFDEVTELEAGKPYIFQSTTGSIALYYGETVQATPVEVNHMIGSYVDTEVEITEENKTSVMYIASNKLWDCSDYQTFTNQKLQVVANRAYIANYDAIEAPASASPAPGRRRITVGKDGQNAATDVDLLNAAEAPVKMLINGQLFILRGEKMYDATGRMVK